MSQEIFNRSKVPFAQIGVIECYWGDICKRATFSIVGKNDILTAAHVVYDRALGGLCTSFKLYLAADFNHLKNRWDDLGTEITFNRFQIDYLSGIYLDGDDNTLNATEASSDFAIIGLDSAVGDQFGRLQLNPFFKSLNSLTALAVGYPNNSPGMMANEVSPSLRTPTTWMTRTAELRPGNSGGPLLVKDNIVGVASAGGDSDSIWGATQAHFGDLLEIIQRNDALLPFPTQSDRQDYRDAANDKAQIFLGFEVDETFAGGGGNDWIDGGAGNDILYGGTGNDRLFGGIGDDALYGNSGKNFLYGGTGNDRYVMSSNKDSVFELADEGIDTISIGLSFTLPQEVENLTLIGKAKINGNGNELNNILIGNAQSNKLKGFGGDDLIDGKGGKDILHGGSGNDTFVLHLGSITRVQDFKSSEDALQISMREFNLSADEVRQGLDLIFVLGTKAVTPEQRFIYKVESGALMFDPDGSGSKAARTIGLFSTENELVSSDVTFTL